MYSFFILGQIPGTGVVISFLMWVELVAVAFTILVWMSYRRRQAFLRYVQPTIGSEPGTNLVTVH